MTNGMHDDTSGAWAGDPWRRFALRWHDGIHWTSHVTDGTEVMLDRPGIRADRPLPPPPPHARPAAPPTIATEQRDDGATSAASAATVYRARDTIGARTADRPRSARWTLIAGCVVVPLIGFVLADARERSDEVSFTPTTTTVASPGSQPPVTVTPSTLPFNTTTTSTTTTAAPELETDPRLVQDCVEYVPFAAYIGDAELGRLWSSIGMDDGRLREHCEGLGLIELIEVSRQRAASEAFMNCANTSMPTAPIVNATSSPSRSAPATTVPRRSPSAPATTVPSPGVASSAGATDPTTTTSTTTTPTTTTTTEPPPTTTTTTVPELPVVPATEPPATDPPADPPADPNPPV